MSVSKRSFITISLATLIGLGSVGVAVYSPLSSPHGETQTKQSETVNFNDLYMKMKRNIVLVGFEEKEEKFVWIGSGFIVLKNNKVYVFTAGHVIQYLQEDIKKQMLIVPVGILSTIRQKAPKVFATRTLISVVDKTGKEPDFGIAEVACTSEEMLAYFKTEYPIKLATNDDVTVGEKVLTVGNMLADGAPLAYSCGEIIHPNPTWPSGGYVYHSCPTLPGNSGSPVFNSKGYCVGIHVAAINRVSLYTSMKVIRNRCEREGFGFFWTD